MTPLDVEHPDRGMSHAQKFEWRLRRNTPIRPKEVEITSKKPESKPWWKKELERYLTKGEEIEHFVLKSFFEGYLRDTYGVETVIDLDKMSRKDKDRFKGSEAEEREMFEADIVEGFELWLKDNKLAMGKKPQSEKRKKESHVDKNLYRLSISNLQMEKYMPRDRALAEEFITLWKSGNVVRIGLGIRDGAIASIALAAKGGNLEKKVYLSAIVFRKIFDGVGPFRTDDKSDPIGFLFESEGGRSNYIFPKTPPEIAEEIFSRVVIEGRKLKDGFSVKFVPMKKKQP
jgi:hypothetical protein